MRKIRQDEEFVDLLEEHSGIILKIARAYTQTQQDREDLVHDITLQLWQSFPRFEGRSAVSTWIYRVALNTAMNYTRTEARKREFMRQAIRLDVQSMAEQDQKDPLINSLYDCISELEPFNKALILLYLDGYSHKEIADITGISLSNVGTRISRIKETLKMSATAKIKHHGME